MKNITYINAGAGSGKTYNLTELLSDVLGKKKARPDEVMGQRRSSVAGLTED